MKDYLNRKYLILNKRYSIMRFVEISVMLIFGSFGLYFLSLGMESDDITINFVIGIMFSGIVLGCTIFGFTQSIYMKRDTNA